MSTPAASSPAISIVTPCRNQASTIRRTIESVAANDDNKIEHIIVDGGSTDGTLEIIAEFPDLKVLSGIDEGPYDAINIGFKHSRGEVLAWLNADDFYLPHALDVVGGVFGAFDNIRWLTSMYPLTANPAGHVTGAGRISCYSRERALHPDALRLNRQVPAMMQQESTFWRRDLWDEAGSGIDTQFRLAADFELWLRFWKLCGPAALESPIGCFRHTDEQRSRVHETEYRREVEAALRLHGISRAGWFRTVLRRSALSLRGLPQSILRYCPFAAEQRVVSRNRQSGDWELRSDFSIPV